MYLRDFSLKPYSTVLDAVTPYSILCIVLFHGVHERSKGHTTGPTIINLINRFDAPVLPGSLLGSRNCI